ncbi:MAG: magnesium-translocating P-type ATPase [Acholeplasmatales bacterium]|jgi:Mg2+-importing ATPase|nr:magnesium-translocating P-type ATPase [Acholeplasmatales bacterium]
MKKDQQTTIKNNLSFYKNASLDLVYEKLNSSEAGLSTTSAKEILAIKGPNIIKSKKKSNPFTRLLAAIINPFNIILMVIAVVTLLTDVIFASKKDYFTFITIVALILVSSIISFIQSEKSALQAAKLAKMIVNCADVLRDGVLISIPLSQIVEGDVLKLSSGDMLPADLRIIKAKDFFLSQASLTGESTPVEKVVFDERDITNFLDFNNIGFSGTNVISGSAYGIVVASGNNTFYASIMDSIAHKKAKNSFEKGTSAISKLLMIITFIMVPIIFLVNGLIKTGDNRWLNAFLFAITVAVGLTPEMLPVILASTLAKGAVKLSKKKVIIKNLSAIQTFGEMDILCTDKTGTLTQDKIILEKYLNPLGEEDMRILRHAYLNSSFQTGLKNLIDIAVINHAVKENMASILSKYTKIDELPFDFERRRMSVILEDNNHKKQLITKGAVEEILKISDFYDINGQVEVITPEVRNQILGVYNKYNNEGLRMLAIAQKNDQITKQFNINDESKLVFLGLIGFLDPPKPSAASAIAALKQHGIRTIVLTGDSEGVAKKVCSYVGIETTISITGENIDNYSDEELKGLVEKCNLFSKLNPSQKQRVVRLLQENKHTVGYMGDGINDAPPLHQADVSISVDTAVDIAKATANIILLEKDLMVLEEGVIEGRKTFGNITKYLKMAASGNFGNMFSLLIASIFLPFLPMLPIHILVQNLLNDFSQLGMPFDNVDNDYLQNPKKWDVKSILRFMLILGPVSSIFDILCFIILWFGFGYQSLATQALFQCGWFIFGTISQIVIIHFIRTKKIPFIQSKPSLSLAISSLSVVVLVLLIGFTIIGSAIDLAIMPVIFIPILIGLLILYSGSILLIKWIYKKKNLNWL